MENRSAEAGARSSASKIKIQGLVAWVLGFRGLGFRGLGVQGVGFTVQGLGFRCWRFMVGMYFHWAIANGLWVTWGSA